MKSPEEIEEELIAAMSEGSSSHEAVLEGLNRLKDAAGLERAEAAAGIYQEELGRRGDKERFLSLLEMRAGWRASDPAFARTCGDLLASLWSDGRGRAFVRAAGFQSGASATDCLRRFRVLISLRAGSVCRHSGWGFGTVREFDDFDERLVIDFDGRPGQRLSYSHAAESLQIAPSDHLMSIRARNPEELRLLARNDPGALVKLALRSLGPMTAEELRSALAAEIPDEHDWRLFWENARRSLRNDPLVRWPSRRTDPIRLLNVPMEFGAAWIERLKSEMNPDAIMEQVAEAGSAGAAWGPDGAAAVGEKLLYAARAYLEKQPHMAALALAAATKSGVTAEAAGAWGEIVDALLESVRFAALISDMPAREIRGFLQIAASRGGEKLAGLCVDNLEKMPLPTLEELLRYLADNGFESMASGALRRALASGSADISVVAWCVRHLDLCEKWRIGSLHLILVTALGLAGSQCRGRDLKARRAIQESLEEGAFLEVFDRLSPSERAEFVKRVRDQRGWNPAAQRSIMARIIMAHPELAGAISSPAPAGPKQAAARVTSWRSFRLRQAALRRLVEEEIPANSREIAVARSYGDLSENAEYKFAKEHQRLLMKRQEEMERDLKEVAPTDFAGYRADCAGVGTCVNMEDSEGAQKTFVILGEWDGDEELGIISCKSAMASRLEGRRPGDQVCLPDGNGGERTWRIRSVEPLSEGIRRWARGDDLAKGSENGFAG